MPHRRIGQTISLPSIPGLDHPANMAITLHLPDRIDPQAPLLFLFPGATYTRRYFDLNFEGQSDYNQAAWHAAQGHIAIAIDHLGTGDSLYGDNIPAGFAQIHPATDAIIRHLSEALTAGTFAPDIPALNPAARIGIGQSMGGHVVIETQANHATFDAVVALGTSFTQTRLVLNPGAKLPPRDADPADHIRAIQSQVDLRASFHCAETPSDLIDRDFDFAAKPDWRTHPPADSGRSLLPNAYAREAAAVRVPVLLGYGQQDVTPDPLADVAMFRSTADIAMRVFPSMGHMHNFAPTRRRLWALLDHFARRISAERTAAL